MRKFVVAAAVAVSALAITATAAASTLTANQALQFEGAGSHVWNVKGGDSPHDTNTKALRLHVGDPTRAATSSSTRSGRFILRPTPRQ